MTERIKVQTVEKKVYVAQDGKEFDSQADCQQYEAAQMYNAAEELVNRLPYFCYTPDCCDPDYSWDWYMVSNEAELRAIQTVLYAQDASGNEYDFPGYACWIAFESGPEGYGEVIGTFAEVCTAAMNFCIGAYKKMESKKVGGTANE